MTLIQLVSLVSMAVIIIFCMAAYVRDHSTYENGIFHRAGCCLWYGYLKLDLAAGYLKHAAAVRLGSICSSFRNQNIPETLYCKEQRLRELRKEISCKSYRKDKYNLKILDQ